MKTLLLNKVWSTLALALLLMLQAVPGMAQGGCSSLSLTVENYQPCCYRLHVQNTTECVPQLRLLIDAGTFVSFGASTQTGWTGTLISPTELLLTHSSGIVPIGASTPVGFCLPPGASPTLTILWDYTCPPGEGCIAEFPLTGCPIVADGSISGVKYRSCNQMPYSNQPTLPGWTISLYTANNVFIDSMVTDANGAYAFTDLLLGNYIVRETSQPGWTPNVPSSGQYTVTLGQSQQLERNFGNCPTCSCESISFSLNPLPGKLDTCCYSLSVQNAAPYCFPFISIHLGSGHFTSSSALAPGWTITPVDAQNIQVYPPAGGTVPAGFVIPVKFCVTGAAQQGIVVSTTSSNGAQMVTCPTAFSFPCPPPTVACCPAGTMQGPNLVINGDFSAVNTGFTSLFPFFAPGGPTGIGQYSVLQSNQVFAANAQWAATDHTASTATGKMLVVDGANATSNIAWREMITVQKDVQYAFCAWINNLVLPSKNYDDPIVQLWVNNVLVATLTPGEIPDNWIQINGVWTATLNGLVPIEIRLGSTQVVGNDFAVDDISFRSCTASAPCAVTTTVTQIDNCGHVQIHAVATGPQPYNFQWCSGQTGPDLDLQLPCGPYSCIVTVTCGDMSTATATATVVISDLIPPLAKCLPGIGVVLNPNCVATADAASIDNGSTDNCQIKMLMLSPSSFTQCGNYPVTLTVTDWCGNTATCTSSIQVHESTPPQIMCPPNITLLCDLQLSPMFTGQATATDNCTPNPVITHTDVTSGQMPCDGTVIRTWTATDLCGNTAVCTQIITVHDIVPPTINCPPNTTVNTLPSVCYYSGSLPPQLSGSDNCRPVTDFVCSLLTPTQSILITQQTQFPKGPNNITCFARDACGNASPNCNFTLTVRDNQLPTITCPGSMSILGILSQGICKAIVNGLAPTVTDNCPNWTVAYSITGVTTGSGPNDASGTNFTAGVSTVTYTVTDCGMNTKTCSFTLNVKCDSVVSPFKCGMAVTTYYSISNSAHKVLSVRDIRNCSAIPHQQNWLAPVIDDPSWTVSNLGEIFGTTIDKFNNIYVCATSIYSQGASLNYGPAGSGGIYKINALTKQPSTFASLPNFNKAGLGNICYDPNHNGQFFVTNLEDGKIYRLNTSGITLSTFDPFQPDNGVPGMACFGERIYGIGLYNDRIYFSLCNQNTFNNGLGANKIYSVAINPVTGVFVGTETLEISLPSLAPYYPGNSNPVTDIEFSAGGKMLLAEHTESDQSGCAQQAYAHASRVLEYAGGGSWTPTGNNFYVGNHNPNFNAAGGVDYGYDCFDPAVTPIGKCDASVWASGDALIFPGEPIGGAYVYGISGMPATGNAPSAGSNYSPLNSIYVDDDLDVASGDKYRVGDVDIIHCGCAQPGSFCDSISVTSTPSPTPTDSCCFRLTIYNQKPNIFTGVALCPQNGVSISSVSVLNGWTLAGYSASMVSLLPPNGNPIPPITQDFIKICLSNYQNVPTQTVIVKYYGSNFEVICVDTLHFTCTQKPKCLKITNLVVDCGPTGTGTYKMSLCIMSNPLIGWNVSSFVLNSPGVTFTPNVFTVSPALTPGNMQCNFMTTVTGAVDGQQICFSVTAHQQDIASGQPLLNCCTDTVMLACATMPECVCNHISASANSIQLEGDTCCWKVGLNNNYSNSFFTGIQLNILTPGVVFGAIHNFIGSGWGLTSTPTQAIFPKINPGGLFIGASAMLPTFCMSGITSTSQVPQIVVLKWLGPNGQVVCVDTLKLYCQPPLESDCAVIVNPQIKCDPASPGSYIFTFQVFNNSGSSVNEVVLNNVLPAGALGTTQFTLSPALANGQTSAVLSTSVLGVPANGQACFLLSLHEKGPNGNQLNCCTHSKPYCYTMPECPDSCKCGPFEFLYSVSHGPLLIKHCGDTLYVPSNPQLPISFLSSFYCIGTNCPPAKVDWILTGPPGFTPIIPLLPALATPGFTIPISNSIFTLPGTYTLMMTGHCGGHDCPCKITFIVAGDSCTCESISPVAFFSYAWPPPVFVPASCNSMTTIQLPCTKPNQQFFFHGNVHCSAASCLRDSVDWAIVAMPSGQFVTGGSVHVSGQNGPGHFDIFLNASAFTPGVQYMLTVTGHCGSKACTCKVNFTLTPCPCTCSTFEHDVSQGFKSMGKVAFSACQRALMPTALCPNDLVMWSINNGATVATSTGNAPQTLFFTGPGVYAVCMTVTRTVNGQVCGTIKHCQTVTVNCNPNPNNPNPAVTHCSLNGVGGNAVSNGNFSDGAVAGHLGNGGAMQAWQVFPNPGDGEVFVDDSTGASDAGHLILQGGKNNFAGVYQQLFDLAENPYIVVEYYVRNYLGENAPLGTAIEFRLQNEPFVGSPSQVIYRDTILSQDSSHWTRKVFSGQSGADSDKRFLVVCLQSDDPAARSVIGLDNLEVCASATTDARHPEQLRHFRIFPNPNPGMFSVELPTPAERQMTFRITDLAGRLMLNQQTDPGSQRQTVEAGSLPPGLYFLQLLANDRVLAVEKFVKQ